MPEPLQCRRCGAELGEAIHECPLPTWAAEPVIALQPAIFRNGPLSHREPGSSVLGPAERERQVSPKPQPISFDEASFAWHKATTNPEVWSDVGRQTVLKAIQKAGSGTALAKALDLNARTVRRWKAGRVTVSPKGLRLLRAYLEKG